MKSIYINITFILMNFHLISQDVILTQFYNNPVYLNPSYTAMDIDARATISSRNQWPNLPANYKTFFFSYEYFLHRYNSACGILLMNDVAGSMNFGNRYVSTSYAYHVKINYEWKISIGIRCGYGYRNLIFEKLVFPDQLQRMSNYTLQPILPEKDKYFDLATGLSINSYNRTLGFSLDHYNKPENSFKSNDYYIPMKFSVHLAYAFFTKKLGSGRKEEIPLIHLINRLMLQNKFYQNEIGLIYKTTFYSVGAIYRGIPFLKSYNNYLINDALALYCSIIYKSFEFAYSYDITISTLTFKSGGAHEISVMYKFYNPQKIKKFKAKMLPCSKF
ncbi:MAG: PorP/SprF family type IX secretion system membrane protein [Bacteroidales bacterium]|nr:PorP/SprF family type IX secretion system membrane protein [Bacteroidales bacterium]